MRFLVDPEASEDEANYRYIVRIYRMRAQAFVTTLRRLDFATHNTLHQKLTMAVVLSVLELRRKYYHQMFSHGFQFVPAQVSTEHG